MSSISLPQTTRYLTFKLADELYAVDVANIREILDVTAITKVPMTPAFMQGVINLRGSVVTVIDLRLKFGISPTECTMNTCIIVMEVTVHGETVILGALADSVQEVLELEPEQIEPAPRIGTKIESGFIRGVGRHNNDFLMILAVNELFSFDDLAGAAVQAAV